MNDDIVILDEGVTPVPAKVKRQAKGIKEVAAPELPLEAPPPPPPLLYAGVKVYAKPGYLYCKPEGAGSFVVLAYTQYHHTTIYEFKERFEAPGMWHNGCPVFTSSEADLALFKTLLERVDIVVQPAEEGGYHRGIGFFSLAPGERMQNTARPGFSMLSFDGSVLWLNGEKIATVGVISQTPEHLFGQIKKFLLSTVKAVKKDLDRTKERIAGTLARRSEDIYLYVKDLPAATEQEQGIRTLLTERFESEYVTDAGAISQLKAQIDSAMSAVKDSTSQLPAGRKGVPLRNGYLKSPVLGELLDSFDLTFEMPYLKATLIFKKDLIVEGIAYGRPKIVLTLVNDKARGKEARYFVFRVTGESLDVRAFIHPHLRGTENWCLGTYIGPIQAAVLGGNIPLLASLMWQYLSRFNDASPLVHLQDCRAAMIGARPRDIVIRRKDGR